MPLEIIVNGESRITPLLSVLDYLRTLEIDPSRVAVELNLDILPKGEYATTLLKQGDRLEIVQFVGGG